MYQTLYITFQRCSYMGQKTFFLDLTITIVTVEVALIQMNSQFS